MYYLEYNLLFITQELKVTLDFLIFCHRGPSFGRFLSMEQKILLGDLVFKYLQLSKTKKNRSTLLSTTSRSLNLCICKDKACVNFYLYQDKNCAG